VEGLLVPTVNLCQIISGGQTGVDRAALDVGLALGLPVRATMPFCMKETKIVKRPNPP
jgi:hypothetical protein